MQNIIKKSYICRNIQGAQIIDAAPDYKPIDGDVAVFEVLEIGKHKTMQNHEKRNCTIMPGDFIMAAFGTRYATAQFEGYLPENAHGELHILGAGGTVGVIASMHSKFSGTGPTKLKMAGLISNIRGEVMNTKKMVAHNLKQFSGAAAASTRVILSIGSSMDSGKTTSAAYLSRGLNQAGFTTAFVKLTGTVYTKDCDLAFDLGAAAVADFSEYGFPSTYMCSKSELLNLYESLISKVLSCNPDFVVMEIADGIFQRETKMLLQDQRFRDTIDTVMFCAGDSLAAIQGIQVLKQWQIAPQFISGLFTASPLLVKEVEELTNLPVFTLAQLGASNIALEMFKGDRLTAPVPYANVS